MVARVSEPLTTEQRCRPEPNPETGHGSPSVLDPEPAEVHSTAHSMGRVDAVRNVWRLESAQVIVSVLQPVMSSAHTVLPGAAGRAVAPQRVASQVTSSSPRPDSASPDTS